MHPDGQLIGGRYALDELIASGGMGQVWRARDTTLNRDVAVKVLRSELTADPTFLARFRAEAQHSAGLVHPHIATLFDYGEVPGPSGDRLAYLVMELVRGESLSALLRRERRLPADRTLDVLRQSAAGLGAAHAAGVVHRDVKPGNVLLGPDGSVKLTDFGVAVSAASVPLTQAGEVIGTANYLSPEQAEGGRATPASDVYALGLVGYECLAGHRGFDGGTPTQIAMRQIREVPPPLPADVPEPVRRLIEQATAKDPRQRFPDGAAFRAAIDDVLAGRSIGADPATARTSLMPAVRVAPSAAAAPLPATQAFVLPPDDEVHDLGELRALEDDEPEPRRRWPWLAAALATLLVVGGGTAGFLQLAADRPEQPAAAPATSSSAPPTVQLVTLTLAELVGRPVTEVQAELVAQQLRVVLQPQETADAPPDTVLTVNPVGELTPGAVITVVHAVAPPPPPAPAPEPAPAPTPAAPSPDSGDTGGDDGDNGGDGGNDDGDDGDDEEDPGDDEDDGGDDGDDRGGRGDGRGGGRGDG